MSSEENVVEFESVIIAQLCEYTRTQQTVHFKWVDCMMYELYLNIPISLKKEARMSKETGDREGVSKTHTQQS